MTGKTLTLNKFKYAVITLLFIAFGNFIGMSYGQEAEKERESVDKKQHDLTIEGEWVQGGLLKGRVSPGSQVHFLNHKVYVSPAGFFILGLGRDAPPELTVTVQQRDVVQSYQFAIKQRVYVTQKIEGVEEKYVSPPESVLKRIFQDNQAVAQSRSLRDSRADFNGGFVWPAQGDISGVYGSQRVFNGKPKRPHYGVDVAAPVGAPVVAPAAGKITLVKNLYYSGWTLILDHGQGLSSSFLHLSKVLVKQGDSVKQGDLIGEVGATGRVTGAHLDWRMNWLNQRIDPQLLVE